MKRLLLIRHAPADWPEGPELRYRGWSDAPLGARGLREAALLAERLAAEPGISAVYSSDLARALHTAQEIGRKIGSPVRVRHDLREIYFGDWEGLSHDEVMTRDPDLCRRWLREPTKAPPPNGETLAECRERVLRELRAIGQESFPGATVAVVGHGGPLRLIACHLLGMPPESHWRLRFDPSSVTTIEWDGEPPVISGLNDLSHLKKGAAGG